MLYTTKSRLSIFEKAFTHCLLVYQNSRSRGQSSVPLIDPFTVKLTRNSTPLEARHGDFPGKGYLDTLHYPTACPGPPSPLAYRLAYLLKQPIARPRLQPCQLLFQSLHLGAAAGRSAFGAWSLHARDWLFRRSRSVIPLGQEQGQGQLRNTFPPTRPYLPPWYYSDQLCSKKLIPVLRS